MVWRIVMGKLICWSPSARRDWRVEGHSRIFPRSLDSLALSSVCDIVCNSDVCLKRVGLQSPDKKSGVRTTTSTTSTFAID